MDTHVDESQLKKTVFGRCSWVITQKMSEGVFSKRIFFPNFRSRASSQRPVRFGSVRFGSGSDRGFIGKDGTRGDDDDDDDVCDSSDDEWSPRSEWECVIDDDDADRCDARVETVRAVVRDDDEW